MIELVDWDAVIRVRYDVLRPGQPPENAYYPYDHAADTFHVAARDERGEVIGCATFYPESLEGIDHHEGAAWVLRGMATRPEYRGQGLGGEVLEFGVAEVARRGGSFVWCRGRSTAGAFYRRHGFVARGEEFDLPVSGPHYVFVRPLAIGVPASLTPPRSELSNEEVGKPDLVGVAAVPPERAGESGTRRHQARPLSLRHIPGAIRR